MLIGLLTSMGSYISQKNSKKSFDLTIISSVKKSEMFFSNVMA